MSWEVLVWLIVSKLIKISCFTGPAIDGCLGSDAGCVWREGLHRPAFLQYDLTQVLTPTAGSLQLTPAALGICISSCGFCLGLLPKQWWSQMCEPVATIKSWTVVLESPNEMSNGQGLDYMWFLKIQLGVPPLWSFICVSPSDHLLRSVNVSFLLKVNKKKIWVMAD